MRRLTGAGDPTLTGRQGEDALPVTHAIADFVLQSTWAGLPERVRTEAGRAFINWVGCATGGADTDTVKTAIRGIEAYAPAGSTTLLGRAERLDQINAAMVNCISSSAHTFDDTHLKTITHPTGPVAAVLLAMSEFRAVSGQELLLALAMGIEIQCRVSNAIVGDGGSRIGWYVTGVSGGIGAAAAAGKILGLDHERLVFALGLAATQACGLRATHGSMAIAYVPAVAARNGLTAAHMAHAGFSCGDIAIDGRNGLLEVLAPGADARAIVDRLGVAYELLDNSYKPYPCGIVIHPSIDACLALSGKGLRHETIERIDVRVHRDAMNLTWRKLPTTVLDAQVSLYHWIAAALVHGHADVEQGELPCISDERVRDLQSKIFVTVDATMASDQAAMSVQRSDGSLMETHVEHATGSIARPMTDNELERKFCMLASRTLGEARAYELLAACRALASGGDPDEVCRLGSLS